MAAKKKAKAKTAKKKSAAKKASAKPKKKPAAKKPAKKPAAKKPATAAKPASAGASLGISAVTGKPLKPLTMKQRLALIRVDPTTGKCPHGLIPETCSFCMSI